MNAFTINLNAIVCEPQLNGYWLWQVEIDEQMAAEDLLGQVLSLSSDSLPSNQFIETWLFAINGQSLQLLSKDANHAESTIDETSTWQLSLNRETQSQRLDWQKPILLVAENLAMANAFVIAKQSQLVQGRCQVILGSEDGFPFMLKPARFIMDMMPAQAIGACTLLEDWKIPNRLASQSGVAGCFDGSTLECLSEYLHNCQRFGDLTDLQIVIFSDAENNDDFKKLCQQFSQVDCHIFA
ncbi:hypothetical protein [Thiomicrorhabdus sediminis]|uniref:Uncharacterized protein n=1 Tax=Thiomicrorhabdus sediminis TaxID=2580412 RepID=A0A4P9K7F5_9GAMM|nr:hypothetical protein [Thiomicrorhabdus sediminis]QCU90841.1 hypothetical protein FE785_09475 [Thiomicrorhabdus sediminis]